MIKKLIALLLLAILLWGAYVAYAFVSSPPKFTAQWGNVSNATTEIVVRGEWEKAVILPVSIDEVAMKFMNITVARTESVKISRKSALIVLGIDNPDIVKALFKYLDNGQRGVAEISVRGSLFRVIPLKFNVKREVSLNILEKLNFTANSTPILGGLAYTPALLGTRASWLGEEKNRGILLMEMRFYNPNSFPIPLSNISFNIYANGVEIGTGYLEKAIVIPANGYATAKTVVEIIGDNIPEAWAIHVRNGEVSTVKVQITLTASFMGKTISIPVKTEQVRIKTNIIEQINEALSQISGG
ncbi:LEA type 2 family protein [Thermococcus sp.]